MQNTKEIKVISENPYEKPINGCSIVGSQVEVIGERTVELEDGKVIDQYVYNVIGYKSQNGLPFAALKANIYLNGEKI